MEIRRRAAAEGAGKMVRSGLWVAAAMALALCPAGVVGAQASGDGTVTLAVPEEEAASSPRPKPRPGTAPAVAPEETAAPAATPQTEPATAPTAETATAAPRDPSKGAVTSLPIPRYVSLKGNEGNARRGPSLTHRIDWVFTTSGMPLRITAEHENWRRVEDAEGMGGWVHYSLLSGVRSALITADLAEFHDSPDPRSGIAFQAERGVIGRLLECDPDWCRVNVQGEKGWVQKEALWGVDPGEVLE